MLNYKNLPFIFEIVCLFYFLAEVSKFSRICASERHLKKPISHWIREAIKQVLFQRYKLGVTVNFRAGIKL